MSLDAALQTFYVEAQEHLESMENILLQMDEGECNNEMLNDIFRSAHTIKGSAGIFGLDHIVSFTHVVENTLDRARDNKFTIDSNLINILFKCRDHMQVLVKLSFDDFQLENEIQQLGIQLIENLAPWSDAPVLATEPEGASDNLSTEDEQPSSELDESQYWHISLRLSPDCLKNGMDPLSFIRFLSTLGEIKHIESLADNFPNLALFDPENLYFAYEIALLSNADRETIENTFMFVQDDSNIKIIPPNAKIEEYIQLIQNLPESNHRLGDILISCKALSQKSLDDALNQQSRENNDSKHKVTDKQKLGEVLQQANAVPEQIIDAAIDKQNQSKASATPSKQIRIDSDRLDHLINLIGELVINQQRIDLLSSLTKDVLLNEAVEDFEDFTEQIRDAALSLRMIPIGGTFQRFKRLVRDTAQQLGKEIELTIKGAETELDRLMVEKLTDPLTHIVRNAMDHGLESIDQRLANGKPSKGQLMLAAYHDAGHIVIAISDDGNGIDKERVREKAIDKGIIHEGSTLTDNELFHLIFHPGFSTAEVVTNLSGRGVGMDVVKRNVEALQGNIEISSEQGVGSTFKIRLPLTLAIIDGFHVECKGTHFIIPQATIIECIDLATHTDIEGRHCINLRGDMIPYLCMEEVFNLSLSSNTAKESQSSKVHVKDKYQRTELVIVQFGGELAGIAVDKLNGEIQTVIKPLGPIFKPLKGIGGSSLMGNGEIAFILDIPQLIELAIGSDTTHSLKNIKE